MHKIIFNISCLVFKTLGCHRFSSTFEYAYAEMFMFVSVISTFEYAYAEMFMFVSVISFYGLKNVTKWLNIQQEVRAVAAAPHTVRSGGVTIELAASSTPPRVPSSRRRVR